MNKRCSTLRELGQTALPLVAVGLVSSVCRFADRFFLGHHSQTTLAAVSPASLLTIVCSCFFITTVSYSGTFIANYYGRGKQQMAIHAFGQGLWMTLFAVPLILLAIPLGHLVISQLGHSVELANAEKTYFDIVMLSQPFMLLSTVLIGYYTAERQTRTVGVCSSAGCLLNLLLDPIFIFGAGPIPSGGITGAALAALVSSVATTGFLALSLMRRRISWKRMTHHLRFDAALSLRILRFSLPNTISYLIGMASFYAFVCATERTGEAALAVSNACLCVNGFYAATIEGLKGALTALTGRLRGSGDLQRMRQTLGQAIKLSAIPYALCSMTYVLAGGILAGLFAANDQDAAIYSALGKTLFLILVANNLLETVQSIITAALLGVGDTKFSMLSACGVQLLFWLPLIVLSLVFSPSVATLWWTFVAWRVLHVAFLILRWKSGAWRSIRLMQD